MVIDYRPRMSAPNWAILTSRQLECPTPSPESFFLPFPATARVYLTHVTPFRGSQTLTLTPAVSVSPSRKIPQPVCIIAKV
jgi:hypothetical protein